MKHTYMSSNFTKKATSLNISFNCNCPFRSSFLLSPSLILHKTRAETLATQAGSRGILSYSLS